MGKPSAPRTPTRPFDTRDLAARKLARTSGELHCEAVPYARIAADLATPTYVYSAGIIDDAFRAIDEALSFVNHFIAYAVKANSNLAIIGRLAKAGAGADIVSGGELARCLRAGMPADRIVFSGVGKQAAEIEFALKEGIRSLHIESPGEVDIIEAVAARLGVRAPLSIRVNPDVDPKTHPYISTGLHGTKFGLEVADTRALVPRILASKHLVLEGLACHIGSQIANATALTEAVAIVGGLIREFRALGAPIRTLDAGGGWPISYGNEDAPMPPSATFGAAIREGLALAKLDPADLELCVEPGRAIVGPAGTLLTRVLYVKHHGDKRFVIVDAAMNDLIRPALYDAHHEVLAVRDAAPSTTRADVVGPVCETGDFLALDRALGEVAPGDLLVLTDAGAYGMTMASNYNTRPRAAEVLVDGADIRIIRRRETYDDLLGPETGL